MSTFVYHAARVCLGLEERAWVSDGELLNADRHVFVRGPGGLASKYLRPGSEPARFAAMHSFLDDVVRPEGRIYKDVVQPFVVAAWLRERELPVLRIRRPLADVAHAMLGQGWTYPAADGLHDGLLRESLIAGLREANRALDSIPAESIDFDDFIHDESVISGALARLYPHGNINAIGYIDQDFIVRRTAILARRSTQTYRDIEALIHE